MRCEWCKRTPVEVTLYRINEKGVPGIWRCQECGGKTETPIVKKIVKILEGKPR